MKNGGVPGCEAGYQGARIFRLVVACFVIPLLVVAGGCVGKRGGQVQPHATQALGKVDFAISCSQPAQMEFNRAVALLHHMTYEPARETFERIATADPGCAMAHWGVAMTLFQPLWPTRPGADALLRGWEEVQKARALQPPTKREQMFIAAADAFFTDPASTDYWLRIRRWADSLATLYKAFPDDPDAASFYALSLLATAPQNIISRDHADRAAKILLRVYAQNPDHPGAMHYLIHADDVPGREKKSLEITRKYESIAPRNAHALHMPTHIYTRLGDWNAVVRGNLRAAEAALDSPAGERREYVWDEFPHAVEYLVYAYLQQGADDRAVEQLKRLKGTARLEPTSKTAFHLASTQARYALERRNWLEAADLVPRQPDSLAWQRFPWAESVVWFARGMGAAHLGRIQDAEAASRRLEDLQVAAHDMGENLFARNIHLLGLELNAWLAHVQRQRQIGEALMREAAELEALTPKHPVTPAPTIPARELLGDLFMEQKRPAEALAAYKAALKLYPRRFNSVLGAARAAKAVGDYPAVFSYYEDLLHVGAGGVRQAALEEARKVIGDGR